MRIPFRTICLTVLVALVASCSRATPDYRSRLVGQWREDRTPYDNNADTQTISLSSDGSFVVEGQRKAGATVSKFTFKGTWWVDGDKYGYKSSYSDPPDVFPVGVSYQDKIISVTDNEWVMLEQSTARKSVAKRVK